VHFGSGVFGLKTQHDAFVGVDRHDETGRLPVEGGLGRKRLVRHRAELDGNFRNLPGEAFAGAKVS